ncbi:hypothetical protein HDF12_004512 [Edaphobacter lichenicola]|uniref:Uncharacterized protein n=1 Tax=Tunturiibacter lichenicola TaxID=2051959 RepID=A0A7Y9TCK4_9BACT|nr:hypothetical protein [Edaphobacter lichenicola]
MIKTSSVGTAALFLLLVSHVTVAQAPKPADSSAWGMLQSSLVDYLSQQNAAFATRYLVQIPEVAISANWDKPSDKAASLSYVADMVPDWDITWRPSNRRFSEEYGRFVTSLDVSTTDTDPRTVQAIQKYMDSSSARAGSAEASRPSYPFYASLSTLKRVRDSGEAQIASGKLAFSWDFKSPSISDTRSSDVRKKRRSFLSFRLSSTSTTDISDLAFREFSFSFAAYQLNVIPVTPGDWYSGYLISRYKAGPFKKGSQVTADTLWGPQGKLGLLVSGLVVAYKPQITVRLSQSDYQRLRRQFRAGAQILIGPFAVGSEAQQSSEEVTWNDESSSFTIRESSPQPQIIAVLSSALNSSISPQVPR